MKHLSSIVLAAAVVAAGAVACFKDPTSSLRNGATRIEVTRTAMTLVTGDSLSIQAEVKDDQGNSYDAVGLTWTTDNAAVATVASDTSKPIPYGVFAKAFVLAVGPGGGVAHIIATYGGLTSSVRVLNLPARLTALATPVVSGTASADTIPGIAGPPAIPAFVFSAGDTLTITTTAGSNLTTTDSTSVHFGSDTTSIISRSGTAIKVLAPVKPFRGRPWVTNLTWTGPTEVGSIYIDSLQSDSVLVARSRFRGTVTQVGDTMFVSAQAGSTLSTGSSRSVVMFDTTAAIVFFNDAVSLKVFSPRAYTGGITVTNVHVGAALVTLPALTSYTMNAPTFGGTITQVGDTMFLTAQPGSMFTTGSSGSGVSFGASAAIVLARDSVSLKVISPVNYTGVVTVTRVLVGTASISVKSPASYTMNQSAFGGTVVTAGKLLDTVRVLGTAITKLDTGSVVTIGGAPAWIVTKFAASATTLDSVYVIAKRPSSTPISISRVNVGGTIIPSLATSGNVVITASPSGELNEPANNAPDSVTITFLTATAGNPFILYGAENDASDADDFFSFTLASARTVHISLQWFGTNSSAGTANDPDLDLYLCDVGCNTAAAQSAGSTNPEALTVTNLAAGSYNIYVNAYGTGGATRPYRLVIY